MQLDGIEDSSEGLKRRRSPNKSFPTVTLEQALVLPKGIVEHGFTDNIQRLTLMNELGMSPNSSRTRELISSSYKYGLTEGNYNSPTLTVTEEGKRMSNSSLSTNADKKLGFSLAIERFEPFLSLYDTLKGNRLRQGPVLHDELRKLSVPDAACTQASAIFTKNLHFLGLVRDISGSEYVDDIDTWPQDERVPSEGRPAAPVQLDPEPSAPPEAGSPVPTSNLEVSVEPKVHINIQIHIDSSATPGQIDQIFSSMARHLYGRDR